MRTASRLLLKSAGVALLPDWRARQRALWSPRCLASFAAFPTGPPAGLMERRGYSRRRRGKDGIAKHVGVLRKLDTRGRLPCR
jgi:hypothetical protein